MNKFLLRLVLVIMCLALPAWARQAEPPNDPVAEPEDPADLQLPPATAPATRPTTRAGRAAEIPPGYQLMEIEGRQLILDPNDELWMRTALASLQPATLPATMPADLLDRLDTRADALKSRMMEELALSDAKPLDEFLNERMRAFLRRVDEYRPPIVYLVTTEPRLKQMMKTGWSDPLFYYNRAGDYVSYNSRINLDPGSHDDLLVPILYDPKTGTDARGQRAVQTVSAMEADVLRKLADWLSNETVVGFVDMVSSLAIAPLELKPDQEWFGVGVAGVMGARYAAALSDSDAGRILDMLSMEVRSPIRAATIDVLKPPDLDTFRAEAIPFFRDAYRRRSMQIVRSLLDRGGDGAVAKVLIEFRKSPPADGPALIKMIQQSTGVDLSADVRPK